MCDCFERDLHSGLLLPKCRGSARRIERAHPQWMGGPGFFGGGVSVTYNTWNPADTHADLTLSGGNLIATRANTSDADRCTRALTACSGKIYWEVEISNVLAGTWRTTGLMALAASLTNYIGSSANGWGYEGSNGRLYNNGSIAVSSLPTSTKQYDYLMFAVDMAAGKLWVGLNGVWFNSGDPGAGTNALATGLSGTLYPAADVYHWTESSTAHFDGPSLAYAPPSGFAVFTNSYVTPTVLRLDPVNLGSGIRVNRGGIRADVNSAGNARALASRSSGKYQFELKIINDASAGSGCAMVGFGTTGTATSTYPGGASTSFGYWTRNGNKYNNGSSSAYGASYTVNDIVGCVLDFTAGTATFYKNGTSQGAITHGLGGALVPIIGNGCGGGTLIYESQDTLNYPVSGATAWPYT